jgi:hypothetical protein
MQLKRLEVTCKLENYKNVHFSLRKFLFHRQRIHPFDQIVFASNEADCVERLYLSDQLCKYRCRQFCVCNASKNLIEKHFYSLSFVAESRLIGVINSFFFAVEEDIRIVDVLSVVNDCDCHQIVVG